MVWLLLAAPGLLLLIYISTLSWEDDFFNSPIPATLVSPFPSSSTTTTTNLQAIPARHLTRRRQNFNTATLFSQAIIFIGTQ